MKDYIKTMLFIISVAIISFVTGYGSKYNVEKRKLDHYNYIIKEKPVHITFMDSTGKSVRYIRDNN